jgi:hypothetical protein
LPKGKRISVKIGSLYCNREGKEKSNGRKGVGEYRRGILGVGFPIPF